MNGFPERRGPGTDDWGRGTRKQRLTRARYSVLSTEYRKLNCWWLSGSLRFGILDSALAHERPRSVIDLVEHAEGVLLAVRDVAAAELRKRIDDVLPRV